MGLCYAITATGCPSISIPGGFIKGLPTGIQIVGKKLDDLNVLRIAKIFEEISKKILSTDVSSGRT